MIRLAALILALSSAPLAGADQAQVEELRLGEWDDRIRLVIDTDRPIEADLLAHGKTLRLHLQATDPRSLSRAIQTALPRQHTVIRRHGIEAQADGSLILALELHTALDAALFTLDPHQEHGHRIVLDLMFPSGPAKATPQPLSASAQSGTAIDRSRAEQVPRDDRSGDFDLIELLAIRRGEWPDRTRLVLETDRELPFSLTRAQPGQHLTLELHGLSASILEPLLSETIPADHELIDRISTSDLDQARVRLDIRLKEHTALNIFNLSPGAGHAHRLVIDLLPRPAPAREAAPSTRHPTEPSPESSPESSLKPAPEPTPLEIELLWLEAILNQQPERHTVLALKTTDGRLMLGEDDLRNWRLRLPDQPDKQHYNEPWYALDHLDIEYRFDRRTLTLDLSAPPTLFVGRAIDSPRPGHIEPTPSDTGGFFNYDLTATHSSSQTAGGGLLELGVFNGLGSGTSTALLRHDQTDDRISLVRLDTTWRRDEPQRLRTLILGDTTSRATAWSGAVRFAGIQYGRNFQTRPEFVTLPMLNLAGEAALPSTLELYVNDALRLRREIQPGPFSIDEIPAITGSGQARLVVRDILGREQILSRDYHASQRLLRQGLHDWSWEAGFIRENYGREDFDYGRALSAATHRYGITDRLTGEVHAQWLEDQGMAGIGASWLLPGGVVAHGASAYSHADHGSGHLHIIGLQRQGRRYSAGFESQFADAGFTRLGSRPDRPLPARQHRAHASTRLHATGSLSLSYTAQHFRQRDDVEFLTARFSQRLGNLGLLNLTALHYLDQDETALTASLSIPMSRPRTSAWINASWRDDNQQATMQVQQSLPPGSGYGYRLRAGLGDRPRHQASLSRRHAYGTWQFEVAQASSQTATRANVSGGIARIGGQLFASRRIDDSFALVRVPDFSDVGIYADNQEVARTNAKGHALVPRLRAYERNRLRIDHADLPLGTRIDGIEETIAPYWRGGVIVDFPVARTRDAFFRVRLEDGQPLPLGAAIEDEHGELWPVGHRGEVFLSDLLPENHLQAHHNGHSCTFELEVPETNDPLPDLGTVTCRETNP